MLLTLALCCGGCLFFVFFEDTTSIKFFPPFFFLFSSSSSSFLLELNMSEVTILFDPALDANLRGAIVGEIMHADRPSVASNENYTRITMTALDLIGILRGKNARSGEGGGLAPPPVPQVPQASDTPGVFTKLSLSFPSPIVFNHSAVINIAHEHIPDELLLVASLGGKFVPPIHFDRDTILLDLNKLRRRDDVERNVDGKFYKEALAYINTYKPKPLTDTQRHIENIVHTAKRFLNDNPDIFVSVADKGNVAVISTKAFYEVKMREHLSLSDVYQKLNTSSHIGLIKRNHTLLLKLSRVGYLGEAHVFSIISQETQIPVMYGVWKPFKHFSLRPILSSINVVGGRLFSVLVDILNRLDKDNKYSLVNTSQLIKEVKELSLKDNDRLFSIDVVSMFTNIQPELALSIILPRLPSVTNLNPELFREIFLFVTKFATEFSCLGDTYKQVSGLPMGTKGSPVIASIVLSHILDTKLLDHGPVTYLRKYVDDTILITSEDNARAILASLNQFDARIKFTMEEENNQGSINFLDVTLFREQGNITTKWYCKPFSSNRLVNWHSEHEPHTITNTAVRYISNMLFYSHLKFHGELIEKAKLILFKNSFPSECIEDCIVKAKEIVAFNIFGENDAENTQFFSTYAPIKVLRTLRKLSGANNSNVKYVNTYSEHNNSSLIFSHLKDPQNLDNLNNVVVRVSCKSCTFFRIVAVTSPLVLYKALNLTKLFHPFTPIYQHISNGNCIGFRTRVERSCGSGSSTLDYTKFLCKKHGIPCNF